MQAAPSQADEGGLTLIGKTFFNRPSGCSASPNLQVGEKFTENPLVGVDAVEKGSQHGEVNNGEGCPSKLSPRRKMQALDSHNHLHFSRKVIGKDDNPTCLLAGNQEGEAAPDRREAIQKGKWLLSRMQTLAEIEALHNYAVNMC